MTSVGTRVLLVAPQAPPYGGMALQAKLLESFMQRDGVFVTFVPSNPEFPARLRFLERFRGMRPFLRCLRFSMQLWRAANQADVIHILACSWLYFLVVVYPAVLIGRLRRKRVILNYRGGEAREFFRTYGWALRAAFTMASIVTSPSKFLASVIEERFHVTVEVVSNLVDFSLFQYRRRPTLRPTILITRHLEKIYDVESALKAFRIIQEAYPEASLCIAGSGSEEGRLRHLAAAWALDRVHFLGHVPHDRLPQLYGECDILLNASRVDNFPGALLEASAAGLAVVSTDAGGIPFIYENGKTALLVPVGDYPGLATAVMKLVQSPTLASQLTDAAVRVAQGCEWKEVRQKLYGIYGFPFAGGIMRDSVVPDMAR